MKYWACKRAAGHAAEALECLGGNGFVEDSGMPLLYRDAPLGSIWEGSGNVAALDVLRAIVKEPAGLPAFMAECELAAGADARLDEHLKRVRDARRRTSSPAVTPVRGAADRRGARARAAGRRCSFATRRRRSPTLLRGAARRRGRPRVRHAAGA